MTDGSELGARFFPASFPGHFLSVGLHISYTKITVAWIVIISMGYCPSSMTAPLCNETVTRKKLRVLSSVVELAPPF